MPGAMPRLPKLLPCPFCGTPKPRWDGHESATEKGQRMFYGQVHCRNEACGACTAYGHESRVAHARWNRRALTVVRMLAKLIPLADNGTAGCVEHEAMVHRARLLCRRAGIRVAGG